VVGPVERLTFAAVDWGTTLVAISDADDPKRAVPASLLSGSESLTSAAPSVRQNTSDRQSLRDYIVGSVSRFTAGCQVQDYKFSI
jgi:hypothetical protein